MKDSPEPEELPQVPLSGVERAEDEDIDDVLDVRTRRPDTEYITISSALQGRPITDSSWISEAELRRRQEGIYHRVTEVFSSKLSSSHPGGIDAS